MIRAKNFTKLTKFVHVVPRILWPLFFPGHGVVVTVVVVESVRSLILNWVSISYGRLDHEDWCTHKSMLCTWNVDRRKMDANKADVAIDLSSCLTCVACHPTQPSWVAGGSFSGMCQQFVVLQLRSFWCHHHTMYNCQNNFPLQYNTMKTFVSCTVVDCWVKSEGRAVAGQESNPRPFDHESATLTTTPPSHPRRFILIDWSIENQVCEHLFHYY